MKARFTRINASQYEVRFSGRFCTIIPFCYTETLNVVCDDGQTVELAASRNLGCLFGTFQHARRRELLLFQRELFVGKRPRLFRVDAHGVLIRPYDPSSHYWG